MTSDRHWRNAGVLGKFFESCSTPLLQELENRPPRSLQALLPSSAVAARQAITPAARDGALLPCFDAINH